MLQNENCLNSLQEPLLRRVLADACGGHYLEFSSQGKLNSLNMSEKS